jgi:hypothetical protein
MKQWIVERKYLVWGLEFGVGSLEWGVWSLEFGVKTRDRIQNARKVWSKKY